MNRGISFFLGLLVGVLICALLFYFDFNLYKKFSHDSVKKEVPKPQHVAPVYVEETQLPKKQNIEYKIEKSAVTEIIEDKQAEEQTEEVTSIYETEFSFEKEEHDDVFIDQLLQTRTVKVKLHPQENADVKLPENFFLFFEIQQWSTPIKNKITFYRSQNMLKIRGLDIKDVSIVFLNDTYLLEVNKRYYPLPETDGFEKLNPIRIP